MDIIGFITAVLNGYKTYIIGALAIACIVINHIWPQPWLNLDPNNWLTDIWTWLAVMTGRSALKKIEAPAPH